MLWPPTYAVPLVRLFACTRTLGLKAWLAPPRRGRSTLVLSLVWLPRAWRGTGHPHPLGLLAEPLLVAVLCVPALPTARTLCRSLRYFPAQQVRSVFEAA